MECMKHPGKPINTVCGEPVCGMCYAESLMAEPYRGSKKFTPIEEWMWKGTLAKTMRGVGSGEI